MAWLNTTKSGVAVPYAKRIKLTIDGSKIEEDLTDFPVLIHLSDESGILNADVTDVFDGLYTGAEIGEEEILVLNMDDVGLTDSSLVPKTVTKYGNVTRTSDKSKFGGYSAYFDGTGDYLTVPDSVIQALEDTPSTIDCWVYFYSLSGGTAYYGNPVFSRSYIGGAGAQVFYVKSDGGVAFYRGSEIYGGTFGFSTAAGAIKISTWHHVALTVDGAYWRIFVDGVKVAEAANSTFWTNKYVNGSTMSSSGVHVGRVYQSNYSSYAGYYKGFMDTLSISKSCKWTSNFTPPNQAYYTAINDAKKLAITSSDGETQQYVEIESWDAANKEAWLWTKCPILYADTNTDLYLYYDKDAADNDTYVGETGSLAATNVWDANFVGVFHLSQNPAGGTGAIKNSTQYGIHATSAGSMTSSDLVDGKVGNGIDFDGSNDYLYTPSASDTFDITDNLTLECIFKWNTSPPSLYKYIISRHDNPNSSNDSYALFFNNLNRLQMGTQGGNIQSTFTAWSTSSFYYVAGTYKSSDLSGDLYINGDSEILSVDNFDTMVGGANSLVIGANAPIVDTYCPGVIDEVRISNTVRSSSWIKSTYYSNWDDLITYRIYHGYIEGFVYEKEIPVQRLLNLHARPYGVLMDSTISSVLNGYYYLETTYSGSHYIVCLDDEDGESYNDLISSRLYPTEIV